MNKAFCKFCIISVLFICASAQAKKLFIIDDDNGMDKAGCFRDAARSPIKTAICDPDGGLELAYMLRDPEVEVLGITCVAGCSTLEVCLEADRKLLKLLGREDIPLLAGASGPKDLGKRTEASDFIVKQVMPRPGEVEILATSPLTNIATAMMAEPALAKNWKTLHFATGEFHGSIGPKSDARFLEWAGYKDLNINVDAAATRYVLEHGGPFPIYPNEVMDEVAMTFSDLRTLKRSGSELGKFIADQSSVMVGIGSGIGRLLGMKGMAVHGLIPAAIAVHPEQFANKTVIGKIKMVETKRNGYIFELSRVPGPDSHLIYLDMKNADALKKQFMDRFK
jgi:purine nucleosidase